MRCSSLSASFGSKTTASSSSTSAKLPTEEVEVECRTAAEVAEAIRTMVVRGAPAIGIAAAYGYALAAAAGRGSRRGRTRAARLAADRGQSRLGARRDARTTRSAEHARAIHRDEVERCRRDVGACRRAASRRERARSRTATPVGSRPAATAAPSERCSRPGSAACSRTSGSTRRGRCCRARV